MVMMRDRRGRSFFFGLRGYVYNQCVMSALDQLFNQIAGTRDELNRCVPQNDAYCLAHLDKIAPNPFGASGCVTIDVKAMTAHMKANYGCAKSSPDQYQQYNNYCRWLGRVAPLIAAYGSHRGKKDDNNVKFTMPTTIPAYKEGSALDVELTKRRGEKKPKQSDKAAPLMPQPEPAPVTLVHPRLNPIRSGVLGGSIRQPLRSTRC